MARVGRIYVHRDHAILWVLTCEECYGNWTVIAVAILLLGLVLSTAVSSCVDVVDFIAFPEAIVSVQHVIVDICAHLGRD